ncbi:MAG: DUF4166 domain-containing protein [Litoreibacter sp.]
MISPRVLIIGGTGVFGKRLAKHLTSLPGIELYVSSRSAEKAEAFARTIHSGAVPVHGIALEHTLTLVAQLEAINPFVVIDCSGPFQTARFDTAEAVLESGAHLIDLADARNYLSNFGDHLDARAKSQNLSALTGASSTPTLSACVVEHLTQGWQRIDSIDLSITPGGKSEVGRSVIEAILSYAGKKIPVWHNGAMGETYGWTGARGILIPKLGRRRVAPVETLDAEFLGKRHAVQGHIRFSAGLESQIEQFGIEWLACLRKYGVISKLDALIPLLLKARKITRIPTSDAGGMLVNIRGINQDGTFVQATWSLLAREDHGPYIPVMPAAAAVEKLLTRGMPNGAGLAEEHLCLDEILAQTAQYNISTNTDIQPVTRGIFESYLGSQEFTDLPDAVRIFHSQEAPPVWQGKADIEGGASFMPKLIARLFGFPATGKDVPVTVTVDKMIAENGDLSERWTRDFAGNGMSSVLTNRRDGSFTEQFGPFIFTLPITAKKDEIEMPVGAWCIGRLPLPRWLAPRSQTREFQDADGAFRFDVRLSLPLLGILAHYRGWLKPVNQKE